MIRVPRIQAKLAAALSAGLVLCGPGFAAAAVGPSCVPSSLNRSALLAGGAVTVSPTPGSRDAAHVTQISFLGVPRSQIGGVVVSGSRSGRHTGRLAAYSQGDGASFLPAKPFEEGELVTVHATLRRGSSRVPFSWSFTVARADTVSRSLETPPIPPNSGSAAHQSYVSRPDLYPAQVTVTVDSGQQAPGDIMLAPYAGIGQYGPMILDSHGHLIWFKPLPKGERAADMRVQQYQGRPVLTWWQDPMPVAGRSDAGLVIADSSYRTVAVVHAGNGYKPDIHAFHILPDGAIVTTIYDAIRCNLGAYGGPADGAIADTVMQEIDPKTGLVRFEWHSIDHVPLSDSYMPVGKRAGSLVHPWDWFHINAVNSDEPGRLLIDSRNTWTTYEVARRSGVVLWRLGGKHSSFQMGPGTRTAWQHDANWQPDGTITIFDNGASPREHPQSRAVVISLDLKHMRATLVKSFLHSPPLVSESQGDFQPLPNGDWFTGWGEQPYFAEFSPEGKTLFDAHLPVYFQSYTVFKYPWSGHPTEPPAIAVRPGSPGGLTVYASWNGATEVAGWQVIGGPSPSQLAPLATAAHSNFETAIGLSSVPAYVAVQALNASGAVLDISPAVKA
ncbi:MAG: arylsulfotransferase family protein [Solirubrobacteraceae bacterium]